MIQLAIDDSGCMPPDGGFDLDELGDVHVDTREELDEEAFTDVDTRVWLSVERRYYDADRPCKWPNILFCESPGVLTRGD